MDFIVGRSNAFGAAGVVSQECRSVVDHYGQTNLNLLLAEAKPKKICSQVGLCTYIIRSLTDIIGAVNDIAFIKDNGDGNRVVLTLKDISGVYLQCTLWGLLQFLTFQDQFPTAKSMVD